MSFGKWCSPLMTPVDKIAEVIDYNSLVEAMRMRADQLQISRENIDEIAGWSDRLAAKLLCLNSSKKSRNGKRSGVRCISLETLGPLLSALGLKLLVVEDPDTIELYRDRRRRRDQSQVRSRKDINPSIGCQGGRCDAR